MALSAFFGTFTNILFELMTDIGYYFTLSGLQLFCLLFLIFFVIESKGKSKKDLEYLYCPDLKPKEYSELKSFGIPQELSSDDS